jgi:sulfopyruvate decarboxylase alpha subunit
MAEAVAPKNNPKNSWGADLFTLLKRHEVRFLPFVPDAGHADLIRLAHEDNDMQPVVLTTEEEGVALACGHWLGGKKSVLLMQSSGVGNTINMLSMLANCRFPFVTLVTMRGEFGEFNSWQVPMGRATPEVLKSMGLTVHTVTQEDQLVKTIDAALYAAYASDQQVAVLLSQALVGRKEW